jgi:hypothetical protein
VDVDAEEARRVISQIAKWADDRCLFVYVLGDERQVDRSQWT